MTSGSVVIVSASRTAMGSFQGSLSSLTAPQLGAAAIAATLERGGLNPAQVDEVLFGNVLPAGIGQGPARQAARQGGLPDACGATTLNKLCGSGMKAIMLGHDLIRAGSANCVITGGMESMSNAPYLLPGARRGYRMGAGQAPDDHMFLDGLQDAESGKLMGAFAQQTADNEGYSREAMDAYAIESLQRACRAIEEGWLRAETVPVSVKTKSGPAEVMDDEQPMQANLERIPTMKPAFARDGTITAANASSISDGASALALMDEAEAQRLGLPIRARIRTHATHSRHPSEFTRAPVGAVEKVLEKSGWTQGDVDLYEINEAFAVVAMLAIDGLSLDPDKVNVTGGACAQGHPIGSTGSRLVVTLLHALERLDKQRGIASLCIGGGEATAVAIERLD